MRVAKTALGLTRVVVALLCLGLSVFVTVLMAFEVVDAPIVYAGHSPFVLAGIEAVCVFSLGSLGVCVFRRVRSRHRCGQFGSVAEPRSG
jgi:hypothetical protein